MATGRELYDGQVMLIQSLFAAVTVVLVSWIPHLILIADGRLPTFTHEENTAFTFWWLVITLGLCATLLALAPIFPLADGHGFSDTGISFTRSSRTTPVALWIAAPPIWAVSALLFYFTGRGLWWRYRPAERQRGDNALRALETLVPPLRGTLNLTTEERQERAQRARQRRAEREKRPEGSLNLPGFVTMLAWVSTLLVGAPLPSLLMWEWPANVRLPLGGLVFLAVATVWVVLTTRLRAPKSWLVLAGLGGLFLVAALYGMAHLSVGLFQWFRTEKPVE